MALFMPGFLITLIFFKETKLLERILLSVAFSIMISIIIGISLGYNQNVKELTGGINSLNVWRIELVLNAFLIFVVLVIYKDRIRIKNIAKIIQLLKLPIKKLKKQKEIVIYRRL